MVGYLTVIPNAMGGQGSMSCGTSKSEAHCQQSESSLKATRGASNTVGRISHGGGKYAKRLLSIAAKQTTGAVIRNGGTATDYLPYSPDLAPCYFYFFFEPLKKQLAGKRFATHADVKQAAAT